MDGPKRDRRGTVCGVASLHAARNSPSTLPKFALIEPETRPMRAVPANNLPTGNVSANWMRLDCAFKSALTSQN